MFVAGSGMFTMYEGGANTEEVVVGANAVGAN